MGERTSGKGGVQNIIELENGRSAGNDHGRLQAASGKNIHRFPNSKERDEWGVMPDLGYELGLDERETHESCRRRDRDVIVAHVRDDKSAAAHPGPASNKPAGGP